MFLAFYKAPGDWRDRLIRAATGSIYSHVEIVPLWRLLPDNTVFSLAASKRDSNRVRYKPVRFRRGHWDFVEVAGDFARVIGKVGEPYDQVGAALSCVPGLARRRPKLCAWFCSELAAYAIELDAPQTYHPGALAERLGLPRGAP